MVRVSPAMLTRRFRIIRALMHITATRVCDYRSQLLAADVTWWELRSQTSPNSLPLCREVTWWMRLSRISRRQQDARLGSCSMSGSSSSSFPGTHSSSPSILELGTDPLQGRVWPRR